MVLTARESLIPKNNDSFPTFQLLILAICRIAEPIALTSIFPYAYPMVQVFLGDDVDNAALYTGILISSFSLAEAITGMYWGSLSDRIGRKPVLLLGCFGTLMSLLMTGMAKTFWFALLARLLGGMLNGNIGVIQTMVGELVKNPEHEPRAFAVMPFVWSIGSILGPAIAGLTSGVEIVPSLPYLLPNLICAGILLLSIGAGYFFLEETLHDKEQSPFDDKDESDFSVASALLATSGVNDGPEADLGSESYGTFNWVDVSRGQHRQVNSDRSSRLPCSQRPEIIFTSKVLMLVAGLSIYLYSIMAYDSLLPIFLQDDKIPKAMAQDANVFNIPGGLGLTTQQVGIIMSGNGLIALFIQGIVFPLTTDFLGVWRTFLLVTILHPTVYFVVPFVVLLPENLVFPGIYACLTLRNLFVIPAYPLFLILIKEAANPKYLGKINGLAASLGAVARCLSPPAAGFLYGLGQQIEFTGIAWWGTGFVAILGAIQVFWIERQKYANSTVRLLCHGAIDGARKDVVCITVTEVEP